MAFPENYTSHDLTNFNNASLTAAGEFEIRHFSQPLILSLGRDTLTLAQIQNVPAYEENLGTPLVVLVDNNTVPDAEPIIVHGWNTRPEQIKASVPQLEDVRMVEGDLTIGRATTPGLKLSEWSSRRHARLSIGLWNLHVSDLYSTAGSTLYVHHDDRGLGNFPRRKYVQLSDSTSITVESLNGRWTRPDSPTS